MNNGSETKVSASKDYISVPDIFITNSTNLTLNWTVFDDPIGSDHLPIIISITNDLSVNMNNLEKFDNNNKMRPKIILILITLMRIYLLN